MPYKNQDIVRHPSGALGIVTSVANTDDRSKASVNWLFGNPQRLKHAWWNDPVFVDARGPKDPSNQLLKVVGNVEEFEEIKVLRDDIKRGCEK